MLHATKTRMVKYEIKRLYDAGLTQTEIAKLLDIPRQKVNMIIHDDKKLDKK